MDWLYLDNNATTQPAPQVIAAMNEVNEQLWANPSSVHRFGQSVRQRVELARASVAKLVGCKDREIIFTSGGTESNNLALRGALNIGAPANTDHRRLLITTKIEHAAVREPAAMLESLGTEVIYLPISVDGWVNPQDVMKALMDHASPGDTVVVSIQWANNETGIVQPIEEIAAQIASCRQMLKQREVEENYAGKSRLLFHVDGTQAVGKMSVNLASIGIDLMTFAAHKFHGPKGIGALFVRSGLKLRPQNLGGPQERDRRGGTENTPGIIGMGVAADLAKAFIEDESAIASKQSMRDRFEKLIIESLPDVVINSGSKPRLWNTSNLGFPRLEAEAILLGLSEKGLCASAGAACSSGSLEPSPVLLAMGIDPMVAHGSVRFSLSRYTTQDEIDRAAKLIPQVVMKLARTLPVG